MLSKLFNSARDILIPKSNSATDIRTQSLVDIEVNDAEMVTTRGGNGIPIVDFDPPVEDLIVVSVPPSSRKRARSPIDEGNLHTSGDEATTSADMKRQKILPVRVKDDEGPRKKTHVVVEIPVRRGLRTSAQTTNSTGEDLEKTAESRDLEEDGTLIHKEARLEIPNSASEDDEQDSGANGSTVKDATKHRRFGSEEPEPVLEPESLYTARENNELDEESSGDDAPEVIGIQDSLKDVKSKERDAAKAIERQESAIRNKRKERDAFLKRQAESVNKKRKHIEESEEEIESSNEEEDEAMGGEDTGPRSKHRHGKASIPNLLPAEYLEDKEDEEVQDVVEPPIKTNKLKFLELAEKKPKDRRIGSTTYRVSETVRIAHLAPKSSFQARSIKEAWLQGRPGKNGSKRKPFTNSFFKSKK
ncbi:hypothetical protein B7494_g4963 [Chlorociboria aeruginascens]|nr:hypothetical protein B7494_g4963 [Chlorociboria aeruginascens]